MKYSKTIIDTALFKQILITVTNDDINFVSFEAIESNPNYVQFLETAQLTDTQVAALEPNTWYEL